MVFLALGLILFLGAHSVRIFADGFRASLVERLGEKPWRGLYSLVSLVGFVLIVIGYGAAMKTAAPAAPAPMALVHLAFGGTLITFILLASAHGPVNHFKAWLKDPMLIGVLIWAGAHLLIKRTPGAELLFGTFALWTLADLWSVNQRRKAGGSPEMGAPKPVATVISIVVGTLIWYVFWRYLHAMLIGVSPASMLG
jgi:uncharacterized membrane protein